MTVSVEGGAPGALRLRVRSSMAVDEPVVQLTVRAGCEMNSSRQYVLLADMPHDASAAIDATAEARPMPFSLPRAEPVDMPRGVARADSGGSASPSTAPARRTRPTQPAPAVVRKRTEDRSEGARAAARATAPRRATATAKPPAAVTPTATPAVSTAAAPPQSGASGSRLQLDALDPASVRSPALAASAAAMPPQSGIETPITAAAVAASAAANTEELQRAAERMHALEATLATLREQSAQNQRMLVEMRSELAEARDSRYSNPLVYLLALLLLLALIAMALLWRLARGATPPAWWGETAPKDEGGPRAAQGALAADEAFEEAKFSAPPAAASQFAATPSLSAILYPDAPDTLPPTLDEDEGETPARYVNTEELFDVQQQSDFFISLGQHDQAIAVLSEHISDNPETSALAYLDLLRIYHSLDRRDDYARVSREFERAFNAQVPAFEQFAEVGNGLEHYRATLARIEAQWPHTGTLSLIEELVFRKPGERGNESFDLAAYRELLLLYSVAKEVIDPDSAPPTPVTPLSFLDTHDGVLESTVPASLDALDRHGPQDTQPDALRDAEHVPGASLPSFYGAIDANPVRDTLLGNDTQFASEVHPGIIEFDTTLLATTPGDLEFVAPPPPAPTTTADLVDPLPDLQLFDPVTEAEIAPKPKRRR